jgi:Uma2 family endonuclease
MRHVIEIISAAKTPTELADKRAWYSRYGVEECLVFHPETGLLEVFIRTPLGLSHGRVLDRQRGSVANSGTRPSQVP